jgi:hypothetical protein
MGRVYAAGLRQEEVTLIDPGRLGRNPPGQQLGQSAGEKPADMLLVLETNRLSASRNK